MGIERHITGAITPRNVRTASGGLRGVLWFLWKPPSRHVPPEYGGHSFRAAAPGPARTLTPEEFRKRAAEMFPVAHEAGKAARAAADEAREQGDTTVVDLEAAAERGRQQAREDFQRILRSP